MKYIIATIVCLTTKFLYAQSNVANLNNVPILLHPSLVGSNESKRAAIAYGVGNSNIGNDRLNVISLDKYQTNYLNLSYDQMWKKVGSGIGAYMNASAIPNQSGATYDYLEPYSKLRSGQWAMGLAFAPKYIIMKRNVPDQVRFTWSPSLSINVNRHWAHRSVDIPENNNHDLIAYSSKHNYHHQTINVLLGGMLNSKTLLLGATVGYGNFYVFNMYKAVNQEGQSNAMIHSYLDYSAIVGLSFPRKDKSLLGFSYTLRLTGARLLNNPNFYKKDHVTLYGNMNLRIWKIVTGISSGSFNNSIYIGYKAKNWKASIGIRRAGYNSSYSFGETIFSYNF